MAHAPYWKAYFKVLEMLNQCTCDKGSLLSAVKDYQDILQKRHGSNSIETDIASWSKLAEERIQGHRVDESVNPMPIFDHIESFNKAFGYTPDYEVWLKTLDSLLENYTDDSSVKQNPAASANLKNKISLLSAKIPTMNEDEIIQSISFLVRDFEAYPGCLHIKSNATNFFAFSAKLIKNKHDEWTEKRKFKPHNPLQKQSIEAKQRERLYLESLEKDIKTIEMVLTVYAVHYLYYCANTSEQVRKLIWNEG